MTPWTAAHRLLCLWGFSRQECWSGLPCPPPGESSNLGIKPRSPALQTDSLPSEPPGKPRNTEVGSLSLLQGIFLTQELNQGVLHCRQILYQQSYREAQECRRPKLKFMLLIKKSSVFFFSFKVYILSLFNFNLWRSWRRYCLIYKQLSQARRAFIMQCTPQSFLGSQSCYRGKWSRVCVQKGTPEKPAAWLTSASPGSSEKLDRLLLLL